LERIPSKYSDWFIPKKKTGVANAPFRAAFALMERMANDHSSDVMFARALADVINRNRQASRSMRKIKAQFRGKPPPVLPREFNEETLNYIARIEHTIEAQESFAQMEVGSGNDTDAESAKSGQKRRKAGLPKGVQLKDDASQKKKSRVPTTGTTDETQSDVSRSGRTLRSLAKH
jgi:hypothetical protein